MPSTIENFRAALKLPSAGTAEASDYARVFDHVLRDMPVPDLAVLWRALQHIAVRDDTPETPPVSAAFRMLSLENADRSYAMILEVLRTEFDKRVLQELGEQPFFELLDRQWTWAAPRVAADAVNSQPLRWLLGSYVAGCGDFDDSDPLADRLLDLADADGWTRDLDERLAAAPPVALESLSLSELAGVWLEEWNRPVKDKTETWHRLWNFESELAERDPSKAVDVIVEMVRQERNENLLALTAGSLLDKIFGERTIGRLIEEAERDERLRAWLNCQILAHHPEPLRAKLYTATDR